MAVEVILPKVDMDMTTGTISKWYVNDGATVKKGQALFDIETDKAAMEIESPGDGVLVVHEAQLGVALPIGTIVGMIYAEGETRTKPVAAKAAAAAVTAPVDVTKAASTILAPSQNGKTRATPLARRLAKLAGLSLDAVAGSGPHGRVVAADVDAASRIVPQAPKAGAMSVLGMGSFDVRALYTEGTYDVTPLDGMRRTIAQRLVQSKQTVPHFYLSTTCTLDGMLSVRERLNAAAPLGADKAPGWKLSINDFVIKALALALQKVPAANVTFTDDGILQHRVSDVGVAVSVEGGLFTPIIRKAEAKSLSQISIEMKALAAKARARKLQPADYQGGTAAVSNLGMFGVEQFNAIINPPHATILAVGAGIERFVPVNKQPVLVTQMACTLSCDHRAVDGAVGAQLLAVFKQLIEEPALMLA